MNKNNPNVDAYLRKDMPWQAEMKELRAILLACKLEEDMKWNKPAYLIDGHVVVAIIPFKKYCSLLFFKGGLLDDPNEILVRPTMNTNAGRQVRFTNLKDIAKAKTVLKKYVRNAIAIERSGLKIKPKKIDELDIPDELLKKFYVMPDLKEAFYALTPGRQRGYIFYFNGAKQPKTREARIEKYIDLILDGEGLNDNYGGKST
jgi:uncharacterized protein YdeI (YjbR/CyaY-like superfamily)